MKSLVRARRREGRCYELAWRAQYSEAAAGFLLVHGKCNAENGSRIGHAWLLDPNTSRLYDPVLDYLYWCGVRQAERAANGSGA